MQFLLCHLFSCWFSIHLQDGRVQIGYDAEVPLLNSTERSTPYSPTLKAYTCQKPAVLPVKMSQPTQDVPINHVLLGILLGTGMDYDTAISAATTYRQVQDEEHSNANDKRQQAGNSSVYGGGQMDAGHANGGSLKRKYGSNELSSWPKRNLPLGQSFSMVRGLKSPTVKTVTPIKVVSPGSPARSVSTGTGNGSVDKAITVKGDNTAATISTNRLKANIMQTIKQNNTYLYRHTAHLFFQYWQFDANVPAVFCMDLVDPRTLKTFWCHRSDLIETALVSQDLFHDLPIPPFFIGLKSIQVRESPGGPNKAQVDIVGKNRIALKKTVLYGFIPAGVDPKEHLRHMTKSIHLLADNPYFKCQYCNSMQQRSSVPLRNAVHFEVDSPEKEGTYYNILKNSGQNAEIKKRGYLKYIFMDEECNDIVVHMFGETAAQDMFRNPELKAFINGFS